MSTRPHEPGGDRDDPTPHTEQNLTADAETGDRDPEVEQRSPRVRRNLEDAVEAWEGRKDDPDR